MSLTIKPKVFEIEGQWKYTLEDRGRGKWAIMKGQTFCLSKSGEFEYEPLPSNRDEAFYERCRFESMDLALAAFEQWLESGRAETETALATFHERCKP